MGIKIIKKHYKNFLFGLLLAAGVYSLNFPLDRDEGSYAYIGWIWLSGNGIPYLSVFDQKTPFPYILYGFGSILTPQSFIGIRILGLLYKIAVIGLLYKITKLFSSSSSIALSIALISGWYIFSIHLEGNAFNTEFAMILPLLVFLYLIIRLMNQNKRNVKLTILCGIAGALAVLGKTIAMYPIALLILWYMYKKRNIVDVIIIFFSALGIIASVLIYFHSYNAYDYFIQDVLIYNRQYVLEGLKPENIIARGGYSGIFGYISWIRMLPEILVPLFILSAVGLVVTFSQKIKSWWIVFLFAVGLWLGAKSGGSREFPHYYLPLAIGLSLCLIPFFTMLNAKKKGILITVITVMLIINALLPQIMIYAKGVRGIQYFQFGSQSDWFNDAVLVGNWVRQNTSKNSTLLVWANEPEIYYYAGKVATTQHVNFYGFNYAPEERKKWYSNILINKPSYIVTYIDDLNMFNDLQEYIKKVHTFKEVTRIGKYVIYKNTST